MATLSRANPSPLLSRAGTRMTDVAEAPAVGIDIGTEYCCVAWVKVRFFFFFLHERRDLNFHPVARTDV